MKKILLSILLNLALATMCFSSPNNSMSLQYSPAPQESIASSGYKSEENNQITTYNLHTHNDITQTGTITSGTWQGTAIGTAYGGTGKDFSATAQGNTLYFSGAGVISALAPGTVNQILQSGGAGANPSWTSTAPDSSKLNNQAASYYLNATNINAGTLATARGGTGTSTSLIKNGSYSGNGTNPQNIAHGLGVAPNCVIIINSTSTEAPCIFITGGAQETSAGNSRAITVDATNIILSTTGSPNTAGQTYKWTAMVSN